MIAKLLNFFGIVRGVVLEDYQGEVCYTWERKTPFGPRAYVYPVTRVGSVILKEDGTTGGKTSYIEKWVYMDG